MQDFKKNGTAIKDVRHLDIFQVLKIVCEIVQIPAGRKNIIVIDFFIGGNSDVVMLKKREKIDSLLIDSGSYVRRCSVANV